MPNLMEATLEGLYFNNQTINRFNYLFNGETATVTKSYGLAFAMGAVYAGATFAPGTIMLKLQNLLCVPYHFIQLTVRDVYSDTDFHQVAFLNDKDGLASGDAASPALAYGFRSNRTRLDIRRGQRRFAGVTETYMGSGGVLAGSGVTLCEELAELMSDALTFIDGSATLTYNPVIVQKERYAVPGSSPVRYAYRYYEDYSVQEDHLMSAIAWENQTTIRTQTSRQYGRGR